MLKKFDAKQVIADFEAMTKDAESIQRQTLKKILEKNGRTEYLEKYGLNGRTDPESFKACVPLVTHEDLECYIKRIANGDDSPILTQIPIKAMSTSSGTTKGKLKLVPYNDEIMETALKVALTSFAFRNCCFPVENGKSLRLIHGSKQYKTDGGLLAATVITHVFRNPLYRMEIPSCSPNEVTSCPDYQQSLYCRLLCGLIFWDEIQVISSPFAHTLVHAFRGFEQYWEELCSDIRKGILSDRISDPSTRIAMSKILEPNLDLAEKIYNKCKGLSDWYGLISALFPNAKYIYAIVTGSMEPYVKKLRHYAGELPLISGNYGSSEGWIALNVNPKLPPELVTYAVLPDAGYFEFIPLLQSLDPHDFTMEPKPVGLTEVKVGNEYELVLTNPAGLYRYKLGDVVKVKGFHNSTPELQFIRRSNLLLTINVDKATEKDLQLAVESASKVLVEAKTEIVDFTSNVDYSSTEPGHYVVYWELCGEAKDDVLQECCNCLDRSFVDVGYVSSRMVKTIGALELRVVKPGTFLEILDHYVGLGAAVTQYKTPRCVVPTNNKVLQILSSNVVKSFLSTAYE